MKKVNYLTALISMAFDLLKYRIKNGTVPKTIAKPIKTYKSSKLEIFLKANAVRIKPILTKYNVKAASRCDNPKSSNW